MRFFFDNCLPPRLAKAVHALVQPDSQAVHLTERFAPQVTDVAWLRALAGEGDWIVLSGDQRIVRNPHERRAWQDARLTAFFLKKAWMSAPLWTFAAHLIQWWPDIMGQAERVKPGAGFLVPFKHAGRFEQVTFPP